MLDNNKPLPRRAVIYAIVLAAIVAVAATAVATWTRSEEPAAPEPETTAGAPATRDTDEAMEWLPYDTDELMDAATVVEEFAELYTGFTADEDIDDYYAALHDYTTTEYAERLSPTRGSESAREALAADGITISSTATTSRIRDLLPGQITYIVDCTTVTSTGPDQTEENFEFAVTVMPGPGGAWRVHDLQLASAGQAGDTTE